MPAYPCKSFIVWQDFTRIQLLAMLHHRSHFLETISQHPLPITRPPPSALMLDRRPPLAPINLQNQALVLVDLVTHQLLEIPRLLRLDPSHRVILQHLGPSNPVTQAISRHLERPLPSPSSLVCLASGVEQQPLNLPSQLQQQIQVNT